MIYAQVSTIFILTILLYEDIKELFGEHSKYKYIFNFRKRNLSHNIQLRNEVIFSFQYDAAARGDNSLLNKLFSKPG